MAEQRRGKRKSPCSDFISGIDELDLSPDNSSSDLIEPDKKVSKTDINNLSVFTSVSSIVSNLASDDADLNKLEQTLSVPVGNFNTNTATRDITVASKENNDTECLEEGEVPDNGDVVDSIIIKDPSPGILIKFRDESIAKLYKLQFLKFLETFVELSVLHSDDPLTLIAEEDNTIDEGWVVVDSTPAKLPEVVETTAEIKKSPPKKRKKKSKPKKDLFIVDTNPSLRTANVELRYSSKFLIEEKNESDSDNPKVKIFAQTCFNCNQGHSLRDCPLPRDYNKIRNARSKHASHQKSSRYHLEEEQKYGHIKPGDISDELREALGLRNNELPPYVYKMRLLGYPPGWLEEAKFVHSNLDMFDIDGNNVKHGLKKKEGLDPDKIVEYPGFNVPLNKGYKDDHKRFYVPPYSDQFKKEVMLDYYEKAYAKQQDNFDSDMDIDNEENLEDDTETKTKNTFSKDKLPPHLKENCRNSPSLNDLEKKKQDLLAALNDNTTSKPKTPSVGALKSISVYLTSEASEDKSTCDENSQGSDCENNPSTPGDYSLNRDANSCVIKETSFGTPIIKGSSPYTRLPNPDNFTKDVSPVINFENLPNSTGKYEQMSGVIQKVRNTLKCLQNSKT